MNPAGMITTIMDLRKWKEYWFNIPLLVFQLWFLIVGTAYGKIKWDDEDRFSHIVVALIFSAYHVSTAAIHIPHWWFYSNNILLIFLILGMWHNIDWGRVWQAAKVSHVRLCLRKKPKVDWLFLQLPEWEYINFGYPEAELQVWRVAQIDGKRFKYYDPMFEPSPEFIAAMIERANKMVKDPVARKYDWLQLALGYVVNFTIWVFCPWLWGKEVVKWFNLPGGLEVCISGLVACLRWADWKSGGLLIGRLNSRFFNDYDTAVVPPCLAPLSENWRER